MVAPLRERVCREQNKHNQNNGCEERDGRAATDVPTELAVVVANFVPVCVRVSLQSEIGDGTGCAGRRCHDPYHQLQEKLINFNIKLEEGKNVKRKVVFYIVYHKGLFISI